MGDDGFALHLDWPVEQLADAAPVEVPPPPPDGAPASDGAEAALRAVAAGLEALSGASAAGFEELREHVAAFGDALRTLAERLAALEDAQARLVPLVEQLVAEVGALRRRPPRVRSGPLPPEQLDEIVAALVKALAPARRAGRA